MTSTLRSIKRELRQVADPRRAVIQSRYFKSGRGEYGEGDRFLGIAMPALRALARMHERASRRVVMALLRSRWHEERMLALLLLVRQYLRGSAAVRRHIAAAYLRSTPYINNWDLVDCSAPYILGLHWAKGDAGRLMRLATSARIWDRRIAVMATFADIRRGRFDRAFAIITRVLDDPHDLIHKAAGWMLREIGKHDRRALERFLNRRASTMPRTMLRYAIERFPDAKRRRYLRTSVPA